MTLSVRDVRVSEFSVHRLHAPSTSSLLLDYQLVQYNCRQFDMLSRRTVPCLTTTILRREILKGEEMETKSPRKPVDMAAVEAGGSYWSPYARVALTPIFSIKCDNDSLPLPQPSHCLTGQHSLRATEPSANPHCCWYHTAMRKVATPGSL